MTRFWRAAGVALGLGAAWLATADQKTTQVHLEVRFLEATSEALRDLGVDIGFGAGISANFVSSERASAIPFLAATWDRMTGDEDLEMDLFGLMAGFRIRLTPDKPLNQSQTSIVLGEGYFENKHKDRLFREKEKGVGFDIGLEVGPVAGSKAPLFRFLFSKRPDTFNKKTQLLIVTAAIPLNIGN